MGTQAAIEHIVLLVLINFKGEILLGKKREVWEILGGHLEAFDKNEKQRILKEFAEESGLLEGVFNIRRLFMTNWPKEGRLRRFEVYEGFYYGKEQELVPLLTEGYSEVRWWNPAEAKDQELTPITRRTIRVLEKERPFYSSCVGYHQIMLGDAQLHGATTRELKKVRWHFQKSLQILRRINGRDSLPLDRTDEAKTGQIVVIVDDDKSTLRTLRENLEVYGYIVHAFSDPREVLTYFEGPDHRVDALVIDQRMPCLTGIELLERIRDKLSGEIPIILMSFLEPPPQDATSITRFLLKPVMPDDLVKALEN